MRVLAFTLSNTTSHTAENYLIVNYTLQVKKAREKQEAAQLEHSLRLLRGSQRMRKEKLEAELEKELKESEESFVKEENRILAIHEREFLALLESATRKAIGRVKKCNCQTSYTCRHNKTASYNTRRPVKQVVEYRRNARRLKHGANFLVTQQSRP